MVHAETDDSRTAASRLVLSDASRQLIWEVVKDLDWKLMGLVRVSAYSLSLLIAGLGLGFSVGLEVEARDLSWLAASATLFIGSILCALWGSVRVKFEPGVYLPMHLGQADGDSLELWQADVLAINQETIHWTESVVAGVTALLSFAIIGSFLFLMRVLL